MHPFARKTIRSLPGFEKLDSYLRRRYSNSNRTGFAAGSYYSPLPNYDDVKARAAELFAKDVELGPSIQLRTDEQRKLLTDISKFYAEFDWPTQAAAGRRFHLDNDFFGVGDALILYAMLRRFRPRQIIEIGSGFSSALMLDTDDRFLNRSVAFTFVDPDTERIRSLLTIEDTKRVRLLKKPVQQVKAELFFALERNDLLFIDSSHVSKIGSDVNYLLFEVLPKLQSGVLVHIHDIIWPFQYPEHWIMKGRSWNEAYIVRAFLQYNDTFRVLLFNSYLGETYRDFLALNMPKFLENSGGSLWLQKQ